MEHASAIEPAENGLTLRPGEIASHGHRIGIGDIQAESEKREAERIIAVNFTSAVALIVPLANYLEQQGRGCLAVISSVAGEPIREWSPKASVMVRIAWVSSPGMTQKVLPGFWASWGRVWRYW